MAIQQIYDSAADGEESETFPGLSSGAQSHDRKAHVQVTVGSGDTLELQGRLDDTLPWAIIGEPYTASVVEAVNLPDEFRVARTAGTGASKFHVKKFN